MFEANGVAAGLVNRIDEVVREKQFIERGPFYMIDGGSSAIPQIGSGWHLDGSTNGWRQRPPELGADSESALGDLPGMQQADFAALRQAGLV